MIIQLHDLHCAIWVRTDDHTLSIAILGVFKMNIKKFNMGMVNNNSFGEDLLQLLINDCFWLHIPPSGDSTLRILQNV